MTPNITTADAITVEPAHLRGLVASGPGHALMWDGRDVFIAPAAMADHGTLLEITTQEEIAATLANDAQPGVPCTLGVIAANVAETARLRLEDRRQIELQMSVSGPYSAALHPYGIHRDQLSYLDFATGDVTTRYRTPAGATAILAMPYFRDSSTPMSITLAPANTDTPTPGPTYTATVPRQTPPAAVAALIATAAGLTPHAARAYPRFNATGFPDTNDTRKRLAVAPTYARALAAHGPGWAIMWNDTHAHPVITRPERGDDGTLLEICHYEDMFTLRSCDRCDHARTCEACTSGQPDFENVAADMSDILGDYHLSIDDIAYCLPGTLPYTRALRAHGYHRHTQGTHYDATNTRTMRHDAYGLAYRSPEGHLVELLIPVDAFPATAPVPPLTIRWTYLGRIAPGDTYPSTDLPADTPPADVAELIRAHLVFHPPAPTTPDTTTGGTDAADTAATGTTA